MPFIEGQGRGALLKLPFREEVGRKITYITELSLRKTARYFIVFIVKLITTESSEWHKQLLYSVLFVQWF